MAVYMGFVPPSMRIFRSPVVKSSTATRSLSAALSPKSTARPPGRSTGATNAGAGALAGAAVSGCGTPPPLAETRCNWGPEEKISVSSLAHAAPKKRGCGSSAISSGWPPPIGTRTSPRSGARKPIQLPSGGKERVQCVASRRRELRSRDAPRLESVELAHVERDAARRFLRDVHEPLAVGRDHDVGAADIRQRRRRGRRHDEARHGQRGRRRRGGRSRAQEIGARDDHGAEHGRDRQRTPPQRLGTSRRSVRGATLERAFERKPHVADVRDALPRDPS